jgi:hypothetical protein
MAERERREEAEAAVEWLTAELAELGLYDLASQTEEETTR